MFHPKLIKSKYIDIINSSEEENNDIPATPNSIACLMFINRLMLRSWWQCLSSVNVPSDRLLRALTFQSTFLLTNHKHHWYQSSLLPSLSAAIFYWTKKALISVQRWVSKTTFECPLLSLKEPSSPQIKKLPSTWIFSTSSGNDKGAISVTKVIPQFSHLAPRLWRSLSLAQIIKSCPQLSPSINTLDVGLTFFWLTFKSIVKSKLTAASHETYLKFCQKYFSERLSVSLKVWLEYFW